MSTRVIVDPGAVSGKRTLDAVRAVLKAKAEIVDLAEALYSTNYGDGGASDFASVEAELGLPAGRGQQAFNLIAGVRDALGDARIVALREIDQG